MPDKTYVVELKFKEDESSKIEYSDRSARLSYPAYKKISGDIAFAANKNNGNISSIILDSSAGIYGGVYDFENEEDGKNFIKLVKTIWNDCDIKIDFSKKTSRRFQKRHSNDIFENKRAIENNYYLEVKHNGELKYFSYLLYTNDSYSENEEKSVVTEYFKAFLPSEYEGVKPEDLYIEVMDQYIFDSYMIDEKFDIVHLLDLYICEENTTPHLSNEEMEVPFFVKDENGSIKYTIDASGWVFSCSKDQLLQLIEDRGKPSFVTEEITQWLFDKGRFELIQDQEYLKNRYEIDMDKFRKQIIFYRPHYNEMFERNEEDQTPTTGI